MDVKEMFLRRGFSTVEVRLIDGDSAYEVYVTGQSLTLQIDNLENERVAVLLKNKDKEIVGTINQRYDEFRAALKARDEEYLVWSRTDARYKRSTKMNFTPFNSDYSSHRDKRGGIEPGWVYVGMGCECSHWITKKHHEWYLSLCESRKTVQSKNGPNYVGGSTTFERYKESRSREEKIEYLLHGALCEISLDGRIELFNTKTRVWTKLQGVDMVRYLSELEDEELGNLIVPWESTRNEQLQDVQG